GFTDQLTNLLPANLTISLPIATDLPGTCDKTAGTGCSNTSPIAPVGVHHYIVTGYFAAKDLKGNKEDRTFMTSATGPQQNSIAAGSVTTTSASAVISLVNTPRTCKNPKTGCTGTNDATSDGVVVVTPAIAGTTMQLPLTVTYHQVDAAGVTEQSLPA